MRYTTIDLQCEDILWFGVDVAGRIAAFTSGGYGNVPEFVCESRETTEKISQYFMTEMKSFTKGKIVGDYEESSEMHKDCELLVSKGIFCFDVSAEDDTLYSKVAIPEHEMKFDNLPDDIRNLLSGNLIDSDFMLSDILQVKHAY